MIADDGIDGRPRGKRLEEEYPVNSFGVENERAGAGLNGLTCLARQTLRRERGQGKKHFSGSADHQQDWHPCPVNAHILLL